MKNVKEMVSFLVGLQNQGIQVHLTDAGWDLITLVLNETQPVIETEDAAV